MKARIKVYRREFTEEEFFPGMKTPMTVRRTTWDSEPDGDGYTAICDKREFRLWLKANGFTFREASEITAAESVTIIVEGDPEGDYHVAYDRLLHVDDSSSDAGTYLMYELTDRLLGYAGRFNIEFEWEAWA